MATINTDTGRIKLIRNCSCGGKALFCLHAWNDTGKGDTVIECCECGSTAHTEFDNVENLNTAIERTIDRWNSRTPEIFNVSNLYPNIMEDKECGCQVCKHLVSCEPNPFGICEEFERKEEK